MQRSRLRNIINKSKAISNKQEVGNPFDEFKKSLPIEIDDNYRLEAAWKAYGSPKDYKHALWEGLIQPIDENNYKLPSIGYNEETDEYEYLNKGEDNETVAKDIRVWDNDVIPLVQELKLGGYVRTFNKEKDCWTYTKNSQKREQPIEDKREQVINSFQGGGITKPSFENWYKTIPKEKNDTTTYDLERAYNELPFEELEAFRTIPEKHLNGKYKKPNHPTYDSNQDPEFKERYGWFGNDEDGWEFHPSPAQLQQHDINWYKEYWDKYEPESTLVIGEYGKPSAWSYNRIPREERLRRFEEKLQKKYNSYLKAQPNSLFVKKPEAFKQGGQMSVIPEGALHARKNNMEGAGEDFTHKGIPVIDNEGEQQAEIERNEIIFSKKVTDKIEELYKKFNSDDKSQSEKDKIAIEMGKVITCEIVKNTDDRTGLIQEVEQSMI